MKTQLAAMLLALAVASPASADKPEWAGKGKPSAGQKDAHRSAMQAKEDLEQNMDDSGKKLKKEKIKKEKESRGDHRDSDDSDGMKKEKGSRGDHRDSDDSDGMKKEKGSRGDHRDSDDSDGMKKEKGSREDHRDSDDSDGMKKEKGSREDHGELRGLEKQRAMKSEQVQKELGQGSETGQETRQGRKKWWRFWGEENQ